MNLFSPPRKYSRLLLVAGLIALGGGCSRNKNQTTTASSNWATKPPAVAPGQYFDPAELQTYGVGPQTGFVDLGRRTPADNSAYGEFLRNKLRPNIACAAAQGLARLIKSEPKDLFAALDPKLQAAVSPLLTAEERRTFNPLANLKAARILSVRMFTGQGMPITDNIGSAKLALYFEDYVTVCEVNVSAKGGTNYELHLQ